MKCSVFIATSADGYIATLDGGVDWLDTGNEVDLGTQADMGFNQFIASVDCMIMGRGCMEKLASFNLTPEQWPYGDLRIIALSKSLQEVPQNLTGKVELYDGDILPLVARLQAEGYQHAYIDGGATITSFLQAQLISHLTITQAPVLLGKGIPLFGELSQQIMLSHAKATTFANDFVQIQYEVSYG